MQALFFILGLLNHISIRALALAAPVQEAFINGVSTWRTERLAQALEIENISASEAPEINKGLEDQAEHFRSRLLEEEYPFLWIGAHCDKVWVKDPVITLALTIAHGVINAGTREIMAVELMFDEYGGSRRQFFRKLRKRRLRRMSLCVSDAHAGIQAAVKKRLLGASRQRCKVHSTRSILARVPHKEKRRFAAYLKQTWLRPDKKSARRTTEHLREEYEDCFPEIDAEKISSINISDRAIRDVRRGAE